MYLAHKRHHIILEIFSVNRKHWTLYRIMYASDSDEIWEEIISKVGDVFICYFAR